MHKLKLVHGGKKKKQKSTEARPYLYKNGDSVSLQFSDGYIQSEMLASDPNHLVLSYTRTMMAFQLFRQNPRHIAVIGLGGGSIVKWCYQYLSSANITAIEIDPHVIALREQFYIPSDDDRLKVICEDGANYVANTKDAPDVLLVDGFNEQGQSPQLCSQQFYKDCYRALAQDGLMVANLCGPDDRQSLQYIRDAFAGRILIVIPEDGENQIVFGVKGERTWVEDTPAEELVTRFMADYVLIPLQVQL